MNRSKAARRTLSAVERDSGGRRDLAVAALLFAATLAVYLQVWNFGFVIVDDSAYVLANPHVLAGITLAGVKWSFTAIHDSNWIPLTWISLMLDTDLYGGRPGGYHLTNVLLHAANSVLLFWALKIATQTTAKSAVVAALFALHPLHVESVAWVAERKDVLSTLFGLLSLLAYVGYATFGRRRRLAASLLFLVLSLLAKQTLVTLPFVFLLLDFWPLGRLNLAGNLPTALAPASAKRAVRARGASPRDPAAVASAAGDWGSSVLPLIREKALFFAASAGFSAVAVFAQSHQGSVMTLRGFSFADRCTNAIVVYAAYLAKTVYPQNLAVYYPHPHDSLPWMAVALSAVLLLAISAAAIACVRRYPFVFVGWFWYLGTLVPLIGLVQIGGQQMADRYTYFPLIGIFLAVTWLVPAVVPSGLLRARVLPAAVLVSLALLAAMSYSQVSYWHDSVTLLQHSMECTPDNSVVHEFLGGAYLAEGEPQEAADELEKSIRLVPTYAPTHFALGGALQQLGRLDEALGQYQRALALDPQSAGGHADLGLVFYKRHDYEVARREYLQALQIEPGFVPALVNLAALCYTTGDYAGAIKYSEQALRRDPTLSNSEMCIAMALRGQGHVEEALRRLEQIAERTPNDPIVRAELDRTLAMKNKPGQTAK